ncbi:hypothetical protein F5Y19DRAFT_490406 [Xylariaceae sp. FL1651]|nr:hypothetical protein F5Y19DRAFT_490406 [Xylariaceae sp. FL1651]
MDHVEKVEETESEGLLGTVSMKFADKDHRRWRLLQYTLVTSILLNVLAVSGWIYWYGWTNGRGSHSSYERGFHTDLRAIKDEIELVQYEYSGGVEVDKDGNFVTDLRGEEYVGHPSKEVDDAWRYIEDGLNIDLRGIEGKVANTFQWPDNGAYFTGLEVFHSLHCLNRLRQALYPNVYSHIFTDPNGPDMEDHIGHCINHLRQSIQCHSDLTPMQWTRAGNKIILSTKTPHTCRNFEKIHAWARDRRTQFDELESVANGSLYIVD